jgi:hypothetical protein
MSHARTAIEFQPEVLGAIKIVALATRQLVVLATEREVMPLVPSRSIGDAIARR